jgi:phosphomannomutase
MKINPNIFRSYDIRGIYPEELNEKVAYQIGRVFVEYTKAKRVVILRDCRLSSPSLSKALTQGIIERGADVYNIGQAPTECLYFTVGYYGYEGGIAITASHNPKNYNGFKLVREKANIIRGKEIGKEITKLKIFSSSKKGQIKKIEIWQDFLNHIFSFVDIKKIKPFRVVIDTGNGMAGKIFPLLEPKLPIEILPLNFTLDGNFPAHSPDPLSKGAIQQISQKILEERADFGFIFDGDADRIFLIDEKGNLVRADITLLLLAKFFLEKCPGAKIIYNLICSRAVPEFIKKWGGKPIKSAVGFVNIRENMFKEGGIMGGELSGHYCFKDNFYSDSAFITFLILLEIISKSKKRVSEMTTSLSPYAKSPQINFKVKRKKIILEEIKKRYSNGKQDFLDGVTIEYEDWWFNLRPSQTEPILRLTLEAKNEKLLEKKKKELINIISSFRN